MWPIIGTLFASASGLVPPHFSKPKLFPHVWGPFARILRRFAPPNLKTNSQHPFVWTKFEAQIANSSIMLPPHHSKPTSVALARAPSCIVETWSTYRRLIIASNEHRKGLDRVTDILDFPRPEIGPPGVAGGKIRYVAGTNNIFVLS